MTPSPDCFSHLIIFPTADDDNELHEPVSCCSSNGDGEERVIATTVPTVKEKLECPVQCREFDGPQDQVLTGM